MLQKRFGQRIAELRRQRGLTQVELDKAVGGSMEFISRPDDHTPIGVVISSHDKKSALYETTVELGGEQRVWLPLRLSVKQMMANAAAGAEPWKSIGRVQFYISEHNYAHGTRLVFDVGEVSLLRLTTPVIAGVDVPRHLLLPSRTLAFGFDVLGTGAVVPGSHIVACSLEANDGAVRAEAQQDLTEPHRMTLAPLGIKPGDYTLRLKIRDAAGKTCSESARPVSLDAGPLY